MAFEDWEVLGFEIYRDFTTAGWCPTSLRLVGRGAAGPCMVGVAIGEVGLFFAWQLWRFSVALRGRCGAWRHWAGSGGALGRL